MSRYSLEYLRDNTRIGYTDKRGAAWHGRKGDSNHFPGAVPFVVAQDLIASWQVLESPVIAMVPCDVEEAQTIDAHGMPAKYITDGSRKALVRSDTHKILGVHSDTYAVHGYGEWLLNNVSTILGETLNIGSCGLLRNGAQAWVQIESPDSFDTPQGVQFRPHLLAVSSLDGSLATAYRRSVTVVVCDNTLSAALGERNSSVFKVKHTRNSELRIADAREALGIISSTADDFMAEVTELCSTTVTDRQWFAFLDAFAPVPVNPGRGRTMAKDKQDILTQMYRRDARCAAWTGTAFGVVQTVNTYAHHESLVRGASRAERNMERAMNGGVDVLDRDTVKVLATVLAR